MSSRSAAALTLVLDTASLYYRAYYALPESMTAPDGFPHNAIRGFLSTMSRLVERTGAPNLACCWDASWRPQWRVDLVPSYKTHRLAEPSASDPDGQGEDDGAEAEPDTLGPQVSAIADILDAMGICRPSITGYEADDLVASLAAQATGPVVVVTGDRDLVQVVDDHRGVRVLLTTNGGMERWPLLDGAAVIERFGVPPHRYVDFAVLRGDPSDGLPGVPGIGAKTAASLLGAFGSLDDVLLAAQDPGTARPMTPRIAATLLAHAHDIGRARIVATAVRDLPVPRDPQTLAIPSVPADPRTLARIADEWGVARFARLPGR